MCSHLCYTDKLQLNYESTHLPKIVFVPQGESVNLILNQ